MLIKTKFLRAKLYEEEEKMLEEITAKTWQEQNRSGRPNQSMIVRDLIRKEHKTLFAV